MTWTRLSDTFTDQPAVLTLSDAAFRSHVEALVWCNRQLTDGAIPVDALRRILSADNPAAVANELAAAGLWELDGQTVRVDWADQEPADRVKDRQANRASIQARFRERQTLHGKGDHTRCLPQHCRHAVTGHVTSNGTSNEMPSRPDPPLPSPTPREGRGGVGGGDAANAASPAPLARAGSRLAAPQLPTRNTP